MASPLKLAYDRSVKIVQAGPWSENKFIVIAAAILTLAQAIAPSMGTEDEETN